MVTLALYLIFVYRCKDTYVELFYIALMSALPATYFIMMYLPFSNFVLQISATFWYRVILGAKTVDDQLQNMSPSAILI